jgi:S-methylmethionine-dependent homocysteine/selenocysteine methylase
MSKEKMLKVILEKIGSSSFLNYSNLATELNTTKELIENSINMLTSMGYIKKSSVDSPNMCNEGCCKCSEDTIESINAKFTLSLTEKGKNFIA